MKKILIALVLAGSLAACGTVPGGNGPAPTPTPIATDATITAIQQAAVKVCGFLPTVQTVADIVTTFTGGGALVALVGNVANAICNAVKPALGARERAEVPAVNGVVIHGKFVR